MEVQLPAEPTAARRARAALVPLREQVDKATFEDLRSVVSELIANAVEHGPGRPISVRVAVDDDGAVRGEVADDGTGLVARRDVAGLDGDGGYGLAIVDALADRWGVHRDSSRVWFEIETRGSG